MAQMQSGGKNLNCSRKSVAKLQKFKHGIATMNWLAERGERVLFHCIHGCGQRSPHPVEEVLNRNMFAWRHGGSSFVHDISVELVVVP